MFNATVGMRPRSSSRPPKRASDCKDGLPSDPSTPEIKCERSPSPLLPERRLVTSGTKRFAPIPNDCLPSRTEYEQNRSKWVTSCVKELRDLSLISERKLIRDDGLIVDWRSHVPVWSDTLLPDPLDLAATIMLVHRSNAQWHRSHIPKQSPQRPVTAVSTQGPLTSSLPMFGDISDTEPPLKKRLLVLPRPSSKRRKKTSQHIPINSPPRGPSSSCSERPRFPDETERETASRSALRDPVSSLANHAPTPSDISPQHGQFSVPWKPPSTIGCQLIASCTSSAAEEIMSEMTLDYLRRYVQTYEADRASLASAYASNASFAYRVHQIVQNISGSASSIRETSLQSFCSGPKRTRVDIVTTLLTLPCLHSSAQSSSIAQIKYDIFYLGAEFGMFVVCRVVMSSKTVVHNFVLQRKEVDTEDAGVWPLTAAAHQILVFQTCARTLER